KTTSRPSTGRWGSMTGPGWCSWPSAPASSPWSPWNPGRRARAATPGEEARRRPRRRGEKGAETITAVGGWAGDEYEAIGSEAGGGQTLQGVVSRITFRNPQTGFTVLRLQVGDGAPDRAAGGLAGGHVSSGRGGALPGWGPGSSGAGEGDPAGAAAVTVVG